MKYTVVGYLAMCQFQDAIQTTVEAKIQIPEWTTK